MLLIIGSLGPIATQLPTSYFLKCLGKHLKYSSCLWPSNTTTLDEAEEAMLGARQLADALQTYLRERFDLPSSKNILRHVLIITCSGRCE